MSKKSPIKKLAEESAKIIKLKNQEIALLRKILAESKGEQGIFLYPESVDVKNLPVVQKVRLEGQPKTQDVRVINLKELEVSTKAEKQDYGWVGSVITSAVKALTRGWIQRLDEGVTVRMDPIDKLTPQPVIMVDFKGRPINPIPAAPMIMGLGGGRLGAAIPQTLVSGRKTVTTPGTAVQLAAAAGCMKVQICAFESNTDKIYVGDSTVNAQPGSERGIMLEPTGSTTIDINNVSKIYIDAKVGGEGVSFTYLS